MRCISAICPAGPPKPRQPIFSQVRNASANCLYGGFHVWISSCLLAPGVQGVVHHHAVLEHFVVILESSATAPSEIASSPGACGARSSRPVSAPRTISGELVQRRVLQAGTSRGRRRSCSARRRARTPRPERRRAPRFSLRQSSLTSGRGHIEKLRIGIDEAAHQPGAGDAVDLRPLAGDPARR